jgi:hypothetical protein
MASSCTFDTTPIARAKVLARQKHRPVYIKGGELCLAKPRGAALTVWPNGSVSLGTANTQQTAREVERRHYAGI